jgi:cellulose synthase/poly-beta-1,6-N-acetylglucosamine synthase-like glycosyltransferase
MTEVSEVLIVVPVLNEAVLIERKLDNLAGLGHAGIALRIVVVDGGSTDETPELVRRWIGERSGCELLPTALRDKTAQLEAALSAQPFGEWILVTDADALLPPDTLERLLAVAREDPAVGVAGVRVRPHAAHALELLHWRLTDWLREREHRRGSAGIVVGPCYLVRRSLLAGLPGDTIADDVHVACRAMLEGYRVGHTPCIVLELRSPRTVRALLRHKFRKADAYLREVIRFAPHVRRFAPPVRAIFLWRALLLTVVPLLGISACLATALVSWSSAATPPADAVALTVLLLLRPVRTVARVLLLAGLLGAVSAAALLMQPFSRQTASFPKTS